MNPWSFAPWRKAKFEKLKIMAYREDPTSIYVVNDAPFEQGRQDKIKGTF